MFFTELSNPEDSRSPFDPFEKKEENHDLDEAGVDGRTYIKERLSFKQDDPFASCTTLRNFWKTFSTNRQNNSED